MKNVFYRICMVNGWNSSKETVYLLINEEKRELLGEFNEPFCHESCDCKDVCNNYVIRKFDDNYQYNKYGDVVFNTTEREMTESIVRVKIDGDYTYIFAKEYNKMKKRISKKAMYGEII